MTNYNFNSPRFTVMKLLSAIRIFFYNKVYHMHISSSAIISPFCFLDKTYPQGIYIGNKSFITRGTVVLSHDFCRSFCCTTKIGNNVFIGVNSVIMPGVVIGDNVIIGSASVVTENIPSNCIAAGNPCRVIKTGVAITDYGIMKQGDD